MTNGHALMTTLHSLGEYLKSPNDFLTIELNIEQGDGKHVLCSTIEMSVDLIATQPPIARVDRRTPTLYPTNQDQKAG